MGFRSCALSWSACIYPALEPGCVLPLSILWLFELINLALNSDGTVCAPLAFALPFLLSPSPWAWTHKVSLLGYTLGATGWGD